ncbi:hypothetical protein [Flavobacterium sp.]|uniref:hypothetical protein n=1 Tax=Flavobacterium sp. TaxID=239 RepID=UPI003D2C9038
MDKTKSKNDFKNIQNLVNDFDLCGLILGGAPIDEYESLTNILLSSFYNNKPKLETQKIIIDEIENYYGMGKIEDENSSKKLKTEIEKLIDKAELEIKNKPSH